MLKVCKFGGSSLASGKLFNVVKDIILSDNSRRIIVVSAPGKRFKNDDKITDLLIKLFENNNSNISINNALVDVNARFSGLFDDLKLDCVLKNKLLSILINNLNSGDRDLFISTGEYICGVVLAKITGYTFVDSKKILLFDYNGKVNRQKTKEACVAALKKFGKIIIPGFYGGYSNGKVKLFERGGSDYSATLISSVVDADLCEIFTDVEGIKNADPSIVQNAKTIDKIDFKNLRKMSGWGSVVVQYSSLEPLLGKKIPLTVKSTFAPEGPYTLLESCMDFSKKPVAIAGKTGFFIFKIKFDNVNCLPVILKEFATVTLNGGLNVMELFVTGEELVFLTERRENCKKDVPLLLNKVNGVSAICCENCAAVCVIGGYVHFDEISDFLAINGVNLRYILAKSQIEGSESDNVFIVEENNFTKTVRLLNGLLFEKE